MVWVRTASVFVLLQRPPAVPAGPLPVAGALPVVLRRGPAGGAEADQAHGGRHHQGSLEGPRTALPQRVSPLLLEGHVSAIQVRVKNNRALSLVVVGPSQMLSLPSSVIMALLLLVPRERVGGR